MIPTVKRLPLVIGAVAFLVAAVLTAPAGAVREIRTPAVLVPPGGRITGAWTSVQEQMPATYAREMAVHFAGQAGEELAALPASEARDMLQGLTEFVVTRNR